MDDFDSNDQEENEHEDDSKEMFEVLMKSKNFLRKPNEDIQTRTSSRF
jgi:hypothetical protein